MSESEKTRLWTAQAQIVLDTIEKNGVYMVKREFILQKYQSMSNLFLKPYDWFVSRASKIVPLPQGAQYAIWVYSDPNMISNYGPGDAIVEIEAPKEKVIMFDEGKWLKILNLSYIPADPEDDARFKKTVRDNGLSHDSQAYTTNFYPILKREIIKSWDRLFDESIRLSEFRMGALWELKNEWIIKVTKA